MRYKPYSGYKDSGVEWLGKVPEHWEITPLKFLSSINDETLPESTDPHFEFAYIDIGNVDPIYGIVETEFHSFKNSPSRARRIVRKGDTIVSTVRTYLRAIATIKENIDNLIASTGFAVIRPRKVSPNYLSFALSSSYFIEMVVSLSQGVSYPAINHSKIAGIFIPIPGKKEQQQIANLLQGKMSALDALIEKKRRQIELLQEKRSALITHAVTKGLDPEVKMKDSGIEWLGEVPDHWEIKNLKWETPIFRGASPRPIDNPVYFDEEGEFAWVRISDVTAAGIYLKSTSQKLSQLGASLSVKLKPGDLFLSIAGSVGKPCITNIKCCIHDGFVYFPKLSCDNKFLFYVFASGEPFKGLGKLGTQLNLNTDTVGAIPVGFPPKKEQHDIIIFLDYKTNEIDILIEKINQSIYTLQEYRSALITATVTGKIDVRESVA